jgi:hypothetical protein
MLKPTHNLNPIVLTNNTCIYTNFKQLEKHGFVVSTESGSCELKKSHALHVQRVPLPCRIQDKKQFFEYDVLLC